MLILPLIIFLAIFAVFAVLATTVFVSVKVYNSKKEKQAETQYQADIKKYDAAKADPKRKHEYISYPTRAYRQDFGDSAAGIITVIAAVIAGIGLLGTLITLVPFNSKYWTVTDQAGTVTSVKTLTVITDSDDAQLSANFVVTLDGKQEVIMDDPRVQNVQVGDDVNLKCTWEWVYAGKDKQNCQFAE
jgi:flagellar basal body-associated protein FliL